MTEVLLDTSLLVAWLDEKDALHKTALPLVHALTDRKVGSIYFDCVVGEAVSVLGRRLQERKQAKQFIALVDRLQERVPQERVTWVSQQTRAYYSAILDLAKKHDGRLNFNDLLIALAAKDAALQYIVSFDSDFDLIPWLTRLKSASDVRKLDS
ncbi:MAG: type II toxin-antitoxin system VapC family toxin [Acidobacteria bacterium]|nr:type II toxin-antitoxin system VapC family toxin [Acidobacteriota bacterium]